MPDQTSPGSDKMDLRYGEQPGLRFACVLDGRGGCYELGWDQIAEWRAENGPLWLHLERDDAHAQAWVLTRSGIDPTAAEALVAEDSRPRVEDYDDALLSVLRGVNRAETDKSLDLVPVHVWADAHRLISLRDKDHYLMALRRIREALVAGKGPRTTGELLAGIAEKVVAGLESAIDDLEEEADRLDDEVLAPGGEDCRPKLGELRRQAINLRRYLTPQREALSRLQIDDATWLSKRDKVRLREVTDKLLRYIESLDSVRDRATILYEDMRAQIAEKHAENASRLTLVAAVLLPPSLLAGLLGANVDGIPFHDQPWAFAAMLALVALVFPLEIWILRRLKWL